jgi:hypothetical protein
LRVDSQRAQLGAGSAIGIPVWQTATWAKSGAVVMLLSDQALLEVCTPDRAAGRVSPRMPVVLGPQDRLRFHPATRPQQAELVLIRPADPDLAPARPRLSARLFTPPIALPTVDASVDWSAQPVLRFDSRPQVLAELESATAAQIAAEPVFAACGIPLAVRIGGPLLARFVNALPAAWRLPGADVRVGVERNELSPGWNPCAVNFHMDGTSRIDKRADGHPDLVAPGRTVEQILVCFGEGAPTRFLVGAIELPEPPLGDRALASGARWQALLAAGIAKGKLVEWTAPPNAMIQFGHGDFHTGSVSQTPGWRCFIKAMRFRRDPLPAAPTFHEHDTITWPIDAATFPSDPCGVFPDDVL